MLLVRAFLNEAFCYTSANILAIYTNTRVMLAGTSSSNMRIVLCIYHNVTLDLQQRSTKMRFSWKYQWS